MSPGFFGNFLSLVHIQQAVNELGISLCGIGNQSVWYWESVCVVLGISLCGIGNQSVWYWESVCVILGVSLFGIGN